MRAPHRIAPIDRRPLLPIDPRGHREHRLEFALNGRHNRKLTLAELRTSLDVPVDLQPHLALAPFRRPPELRIILPPVEHPVPHRNPVDRQMHVVAVRIQIVM